MVRRCVVYGCGHYVRLNILSTNFRRIRKSFAWNERTKAVFTLAILPDASGCPCTHCVHCVGFVRYTQTTSGCVRSGCERFASAWLCSVNARVDASGRERRAICACLQTDLFFSSPLICNAANLAQKSWHFGVKVIRWLINIQEVEIGQLTAEKRFLDVSLVRTWSTRDAIDTGSGKRYMCHGLSTCNWVTTDHEANAVCTWRTVRVPFASGQSLVVWMQIRHEVDPTRTVRYNPVRNRTQCEHGLIHPATNSQAKPSSAKRISTAIVTARKSYDGWIVGLRGEEKKNICTWHCP